MAYQVLIPEPMDPGETQFHNNRPGLILLFSDGLQKPKHQQHNLGLKYLQPAQLSCHLFAMLKYQLV